MESTRSWQFAAARGLAVTMAALAALACVHVLLTGPPLPPSYARVPLLSQLAVMRYEFSPLAWRPWIVGFVALSILMEAALAMVLVRSAGKVTSARQLMVAFGTGSYAWAWFAFLNATPLVRQVLTAPAACVAADVFAAAAAGFSSGLFARVFVGYPRPISEAEWAPQGTRRRALALREYRWLTSPRTPWACAAILGVAPCLAYALLVMFGDPGQVDSLVPAMGLVRAVFRMVVILPFVVIPMVALAASVRALMRQAALGSESGRRQFAWIYWPFAGLNGLFAVSGVLLLFWIAIELALSKRTAGGAMEQLPFLLPVLVPTLYADVLMLSLAASIFYHGAVDPKLAVGKISSWTFLVLALAFVFLLLERFIARWAVDFFGWSRDTGGVVAGAITALTIGPLRKRTERAVQSLADRWQPARPVEGKRATRTVCCVDIGGYSPVAMLDEPRALLLAAILVRQATAISARHDGRVAKAMGDSVMCEFEDAGKALAAVREINAAFARACCAVEVEPLPLRSGIHTGEVTLTPQGDVFGSTVDLASRLQGFAAEGETVMSRQALDAARIHPSTADSLGFQSFKHVPEPVACFRLRPVLPVDATQSDVRANCG
jgi:class 3 adenylate cyclase